MQLIPAIDLKAGKCVRLLRGMFEQVTEYDKDPSELAQSYAQSGAPWLHIVDLDGAKEGVQSNLPTIEAMVRATSAKVQVGGGLRTASSIRKVLDLGVARVVIGSAAATRAAETRDWLRSFGASRVVLALDVRLNSSGTPHVLTHGWTRESEMSLWKAIDRYTAAGVRHIVCTDVDRDGALSGPNLDLYRNCVQRYPGKRFQASGGVRHFADLERLEEIGVAAAISGTALLEKRIKPEEMAAFWQKE